MSQQHYRTGFWAPGSVTASKKICLSIEPGGFPKMYTPREKGSTSMLSIGWCPMFQKQFVISQSKWLLANNNIKKNWCSPLLINKKDESTIEIGWLWHQLNNFLFCQFFWKTFNPIVEIFKSLDCKILESNSGLVQLSTLVVNTLTTRTIRKLWNWDRI